MQTLFKSLKVIIIVLFLSFVTGNTLTKAQTPSSLPGPTPGVTSSTGGDGSPEVPFDGRMSLILVASGIVYITRKLRDKTNILMY